MTKTVAQGLAYAYDPAGGRLCLRPAERPEGAVPDYGDGRGASRELDLVRTTA
ncbi:hypothetical protein ABZT48_19175 [Streptomyces avermitilis]|uniref:hypothetical protein n=1 Tax=Streptomyces avermitilis TaxID=33903 RepID=UPI0033BFA138